MSSTIRGVDEHSALPRHHAAKIAADLKRFLDQLAADGSYDPKSIRIDLKITEVLDRVRRAYELEVGVAEAKRFPSGSS